MLASFYGYARNIQFLAYGARRNSVGGHSHRESVNRLQSQAGRTLSSVGGHAKRRQIAGLWSQENGQVVRVYLTKGPEEERKTAPLGLLLF